ncbi:transglutaminaseTgpA domain-containing protein [Nakamurella deserti]|uniref:transglutaminase family protein n=1 Tax=Nakamurella deserti TaxID=2164074 RepID=UPI000DBE6E0B|nr:DUF3488 and transglutaminase-like domain-containing protein [Nakamurella deserti]
MSAPTLTRPSAGDTPAPRAGRTPVMPKPFASALGALSVLAGSVALGTILDGGEWIAPMVQIVGLVWLIGLGCRLLRVPAPVTVLAQAAGIVVTLTAVFTSGGYGGLIPNARAVREAHTLLSGAWDQIVQSTVPAPASPELSFLIAISLGLIALIVDFFVSEVDAPALVALPLLCLYSVPASISEALLPWWAFALPAACYAALVAVGGHPGRRVGLRAGVGVAAAGGLALLLAIGSSVIVADSITDVGTAGRLDRSGQGGGGSNIGLSAFASLHGDLVRGESREVLRVNGLPEADYLRTTALEAWTAGEGFGLVDPDDGAQAAGSPIDVRPLARNPGALPAQVEVQVLSFSDRFVPMYQGTSQVTGLEDDYSYNPELGSIFRDGSTRPENYRLTVGAGEIPQEELRADTVTPTETLTSAEGISELAAAEAQRVTADGATPFDKALLLREWFKDPANGFTYDLQVPVGNSGDLLTDFLTSKQGYCEQYAAAMAVMLRSLDIPARVAIGFTQGTQESSGSWLIDSHDAHAWVEVRFDNAGWVRFDPTPLAEGGSLDGFAASTAPSAESSAPTSAAATDDVPDDIPSNEPRQTRTEVSTVTVADGGQGNTTPFWQPWMTWTLVLLLVLGAALAVPGALRRRRRDRRLAEAVAGGAGAPGAAWSELEDLATDHGLDLDSGVTIRKAANQLARDGKLTEVSRGGLRRIVLAAESSWYSPDGYAPVAPSDAAPVAADGAGSTAPAAGTAGTLTADRPAADLAEDVRRIAVDLEHAAPRGLRDRLLPRSVFRRSNRP